MADLKNIVIIGGSISGHTLANNLVDKLPANHRILLIDALDFVVWPVASLRGAVVPGWEKRVHAPLQTEYVFSAGSIHQVIAPNKVIELKKSSVVLEKPFEGKTEIPFVKAVIATGASQPAPMRPAPGSTEAEYEALLKDYQRDLSKAKKVVVVGGGAAGTEVAGEIKHQFPSIDVTIVHSQSQILNPATKGLTPATNSDSKSKSWSAAPTPAKFSPPIEKKLKELKINLILNEKVQIPQSKTGIAVGEWDGSFGFQGQIKKLRLSSGKSVEADFVFLSVGNQANGSIVEKADSGAIVNGMGKMVDVDDYLKVQSSNPDSILTANYYAIGDVAASQEFKTSQTALANANIVTKNLLAELQGKPLKRYTPPGMHGLVIPIGPDHVLGGLTVPYLGSLGLPNFMGKSAKGVRLMVEDYFYPIFKGAKPVPTAPLPAA